MRADPRLRRVRRVTTAERVEENGRRPASRHGRGEGGRGIRLDDASGLAPMMRLLIGGACAVIVLAGMRAMAQLLVPLVLTAMVVLATTPVLLRLQRRGVPPRIAVLGVYIVLVVLGLALLLYFGLLLHKFTVNLPSYSAQLQGRMAEFEEFLTDLGIPIPSGGLGSDAVLDTAEWIADQLLSTVQTAIFVFPAAMLILLESPRLMARIPKTLERDDRLIRGLSDFRDSLIGFLVVSTQAGLILAIGATVILFLLGVDFPVFFGMLTFIANYIPSIGLLFAAVPAVTMTWVQYGWWRAALAALGFLVLSMVVGSTIQRGAMRRRLDLSGGIIFIGAFIWAWVLGPAGVLLATPIMALIKVILESSSQTRWLALLMSERAPARDARQSRRRGATSAPDRG